MEKYFVIYNPLAGDGDGQLAAECLAVVLDTVVGIADITKITNYKAFLEDKTDCILILCGGDGTLNRFVNDIEGLHIPNQIMYYAVGTGNDFLRDIEALGYNEPIEITEYIQKLPVCEANGIKYRFINGVGFGIDGYCCEEGNRIRKETNKKVNYVSIIIKALLHKYKPTGVTVKIDGVTQRFDKVWLAPTMFGRYYSGGMMPTPEQNRKVEEQKISLFLFHNIGKFKALLIFPKIFQGKHIRYKQYVSVISGKEVTVEFDTPKPLQIDGETIKSIKKYSVHVYNPDEVIRRRHES